MAGSFQQPETIIAFKDNSMAPAILSEANTEQNRRIAHVHAPSIMEARCFGERSGDIKAASSFHDHNDGSAMHPLWSPSQNSFPFPSPEMNDTFRAGNDGPAYVVPRIASSLRSYNTAWAKCKAASSRNPHKNTAENRFDKKIEERFRCAIVSNKIDVIMDTSVTGKYASRPLTPYGYEPSTESACKQEDYPIIKINMGEIPEDKQKLSPLAYYQTYDAVSMRYEPRLKGSCSNPAEVKTAFPLGAAAAGTRSALMSFMTARTEEAGPSTHGENTAFQQSLTNMNEMHQSSEISSRNVYSHETHCPWNPIEHRSIPAKVMVPKVENNVSKSITSSVTGGKKISNVWKKKLVQRADKSRQQSIQADSDHEYNTDDSRSIRVLDTDSKSESSSLRRTKRKRTSRKKYEM
jgi:hypothetical protein